MAKPSNRELHALRNLISEADLILSTTTLPEGRATRCRELLGAAIALAEDFITQANLTPAAVLGRKGGNTTWYAKCCIGALSTRRTDSMPNTPNIQVIFKLSITIRHDGEASVFVSHCPALGVYSQADSEPEAIEAIREAAMLYLQTAYEHDRLDQILRRSGFTAMQPPP
jgi:predicted RNase H-like HicB family nuclease